MQYYKCPGCEGVLRKLIPGGNMAHAFDKLIDEGKTYEEAKALLSEIEKKGHETCKTCRQKREELIANRICSSCKLVSIADREGAFMCVSCSRGIANDIYIMIGKKY